ncbi:hypothetical protein HXX76_003391 [Chlamydomonas incerta]|uniref:CobW/HypB/UreG nucleotide-binding domain-containing protein n=1 Tax=Chlamydomonas incerta TaxID=51695 RepID=A0A835W8N6_CHLIN|nr:hypothetical protein HXX76_003391 [Chlamydomonas incerta]|eukprot:KAG2441778.1 hypothetical protein HXX76_003391 [Chlamydomonas incerta]
MKLPIPVNIITGALGVGKTTAVAHLLRSKPPGEKWALLVNEFGSLGIDAALLQAELEAGQAQDAQEEQEEQEQQPQGQGGAGRGAGGAGSSEPAGSSPSNSNGNPSSSSSNGASNGYVVRELAGGCLCCTLSGPLGVAIAQLVRNARPDRLIIEPSGLGHPAGLLDTLYGEHLRTALDVRAVVCLVDVRVAAAEVEAAAGGAPAAGGAGVPSETFQDQVNVADVVVGHKADLAAPQQLADFWGWAAQLYPPKAQVLLASHGAVDPAVLDLPRAPVFRPLFNPQSHSSRRRAAQQQRQRQGQAQRQAQAAAPTSGGSAPTALLAGLALQDRAGPGPAPGPGPAHGEAEVEVEDETASQLQVQLAPRRPLRFPSHAPVAPGAPQGQQEQVQGQQSHGQQGQGPQEQGQQDQQGQGQQVSCGWLFSSEDVFERQALAALLAAVWPAVARLKGIFRVGKSSYVVPYRQPDGGSNAGGGGGAGAGVELRPISYRRESRLEIIVDVPGVAEAEALGGGAGMRSGGSGKQAGGAPGEAGASGGAVSDCDAAALGAAVAAADWDAVERALLACLKP